MTVRLHEESIKALLLDKVRTSDQPERMKRKLVDAINGMPAAGLTALSMRAIETGLDHSGEWLWSMLIGT